LEAEIAAMRIELALKDQLPRFEEPIGNERDVTSPK
jgi:hypothetical protein